jgi:hypothetical protein
MSRQMEVSMSIAKLARAALVLLLTTSCTSRDTEATYATPSTVCRQTADEDHVLEKVGRTIFWLEIKLMEQTKKTSSECEVKPK